MKMINIGKFNMYNDIFLFIKLVDLESYSTTAKILHLQQSTITRKIQTLEEKLNVRLFHRNTHSLTLTEAGHNLYNKFKYYEQFLSNNLQAMRTLTDNDFSGIIRVALAPIVAEQLVIPQLANFNAQFPKISLHITMRATSFDLIKEGFDIALGVRKLANSDIIDEKILKKFQIKLFTTSEYGAKHKLPQFPEDLHQHKLINGAIDRQNKKFIIKNLVTQKEETIYLNSRINHDDVYLSIRLAENGDFIFGAPDCIMQERVKSGKFIEVLPDYVLKEIPCYLTQNIITQNSLTRKFAQFLSQCIVE